MEAMLDTMLATIRATAPVDGSSSVARAWLYVLTLAVLQTREAQHAIQTLAPEPAF